MDKLKWTTPSKRDIRYESPRMLSPKVYKTPIKQSEVRAKHLACHNNTGTFSVLPSHITPPSGLTKFIARNPFESDLTNRLHLSVISPTVFSKVLSPSEQSPGFAWSVEELALIQPAKIEEFPTQQVNNIDPEIEVKAQAAIDQFFNENHIIPSPWELRKKESKWKIKLSTPTHNGIKPNRESPMLRKDGWSQTILSLPPELPPTVEEALKPYFTFTQEQNVESDDANSCNSSLRRKLFFNHEDCFDNEDEDSALSPMKMNGSLVLSSCSPPQSGALVHGTPLKHSLQIMQRDHGTPVTISRNLSPPNMSPIYNTSCDSMRSRSRSVARLDFTTDMSVDHSILENTFYTTSKLRTSEEEASESERLLNDSKHMKFSTSPKVEVMPKNSTLYEKSAKTELKMLTDSCKVYTNESCILQKTNTLLGISDLQSISNSRQDTGYQTYSMSSTTNAIDSCNETQVKEKLCWGDRILLTEDEVRMSDWKQNMRNVFSSTPSRHNRGMDSLIN
ncbi:hypothetical protein KM043_012408 [Ampulex compressa]|nr:hypothetical protein KM043_012408 [Ampulex compressa]